MSEIAADLDSLNMLLGARAVHALGKKLEGKSVPLGHGRGHAVAVMTHVYKALSDDKHRGRASLTVTEQRALVLAGCLHDASDPKYFASTDGGNVEDIVRFAIEPLSLRIEQQEELVRRTKQIVSYVSTSKHKGAIPEEAIVRPYVLYPRFGDSLEALGLIGIARVNEVSIERKNPQVTEATPRPESRDELRDILRKSSLADYGKSADKSMLGHCWEKLLHLKSSTDWGGNRYFLQEAEARHCVIEDFCLSFGETGQIDEEVLEQANQHMKKVY